MILRYRRCVRPGGQVGPSRSQKTLKGTWAGQVLLFLLHVVHIQRFRSVATTEYWWSFSMHLNANKSFVQTADCACGTTDAFQSMYRSNYLMDVRNSHVLWSKRGPSSPMFGNVSILYDYSISIQIIPFVADEWFTIFQWWNMAAPLVRSWDDHSLRVWTMARMHLQVPCYLQLSICEPHVVHKFPLCLTCFVVASPHGTPCCVLAAVPHVH